MRHAALGLLARGIPTAIVTDAVKELDTSNARTFLDAFTQAGGTLTTTAKVTKP